ncbi:MAG: hypothetical protein KC414_13920 [Romboutsia sp.]|nr:hypothetical protein [Romboutsia sp.]
MPTGDRYKDQQNRVQEAYAFFKGRGYSDIQTSAIVGNLMEESGNFSSDVINGKRRGDGGKAFGIAQWHPDRQQVYKKNFGKDLTSTNFQEQLRFVHFELQNTERKALEKLSKATNVNDAAYLIDKHYERSAGTATSKRQANARNVYNQFSGKTLDDIDNNTDNGFLNAVAGQGDVSQFLPLLVNLVETKQKEEEIRKQELEDNQYKAALQEKINQRDFLASLINQTGVEFVERNPNKNLQG